MKLLSLEQIEEAKRLRDMGYTKRKLAEIFMVGQTTIWDNVFRTEYKRRVKKRRKAKVYFWHKRPRKIKDLPFVVDLIRRMRDNGVSSGYVSERLQIPLEEVNFIYSYFPPKFNNNELNAFYENKQEEKQEIKETVLT